jgi:hypothetical protein
MATRVGGDVVGVSAGRSKRRWLAVGGRVQLEVSVALSPGRRAKKKWYSTGTVH